MKFKIKDHRISTKSFFEWINQFLRWIAISFLDLFMPRKSFFKITGSALNLNFGPYILVHIMDKRCISALDFIGWRRLWSCSAESIISKLLLEKVFFVFNRRKTCYNQGNLFCRWLSISYLYLELTLSIGQLLSCRLLFFFKSAISTVQNSFAQFQWCIKIFVRYR